MKIQKSISFVPIVAFLLLAAFSSCKTYKNVPYFVDFADTSLHTQVKTVAFKSPVIQPDDIVSIVIQTIDPDITLMLNTANAATPAIGATATSTAGQQQVAAGYLVDKNGEVELPFAGKIKIQGYTTSEAREVIRDAISKYVKNPIVNVRFTNFKITVLGEVARPSSYVVPNEKLSVLDALGLAGDLTIYGRRENVLLIRDSLDNQKSLVHLNLNTKEVIASPYYYLKPNDIIYVEPNKSKAASTDAVKNKNFAIAASLMSVLIIALTRIK